MAEPRPAAKRPKAVVRKKLLADDDQPMTRQPMTRQAQPAPTVTAGDEVRAHEPRAAFPIVGIGASAGGLEALEQFLKRVPEKSGMAFVVIQHLDPTHKGVLVELLQRASKMPVLQAKDRMKVEPEHVYVIPPNKDMSLLHGTLHLLPQASPRGLNLPIDFFFRSLAEDQQERGIGVILSGMGSDGTLGLRAIKEKAGAAFVQSLASAKFDGMPRSAVDAGLADVVAPVEELPAKLVAYREHAPRISRPDVTPVEEKAQSAVEKVFILLRAQTGNDFSLYKRSTIYRRIERRMGLHQIDSIAHYVRFLRENPRETELLFKELLIGVTSFFRDPAAWEYLKSEVMPTLLSTRSGGGVLRAWVPGCSTGEEAYSLAMVFKEAVEPLRPFRNVTLQIFATDLDGDAIERARQGVYPDNIVADVSPERLRRFFVQEERGYRVGKEVREMVVFAPQNIIMDPPFTKLDVLSCRNLLIYLSAELQKRLIPLFHYSLNSGGILFLGSAETVGGFASLFAPLDAKTRLYRRLDEAVAGWLLDFPAVGRGVSAEARGRAEAESPAEPRPTPINVQALADRALVQHYAPVGVLCNERGDILYISARAGKYLEPAVGKANLNIFAMAREGLRYELSRTFSAALHEEQAVHLRGVKIVVNGGTQTVDLAVQRLLEPKELRGTVMVVIADVAAATATPPKARRGGEPTRIAELEHELQRAREDVQTTREEMQTSQEELKSTNEELQSTNEELQSTNEELTTSKEEMQSLNEELQTVNHELQSKVDELSRSNNDMKNLLNSTDIATLFLDDELRVRRFTTPTAKIIKLIPGDTGRAITDIASDLEYSALPEDAREVLRTLVFKERLVSSRDGQWFAVRIMPYRTLENVIDGVVITFTDASASRVLDATLRDQASQLKQMAESLPSLVWGCQADGACDYISKQWIEYAGVPEREQSSYKWLDQVHPEDRRAVRETWRAAVKAGRRFDSEFRLRGEGGTYRWFKSGSVPIRDAKGMILRWWGTATDVDELKRRITERGRSFSGLAAALEHISEGFIALDDEMMVTFFNPAAERMLERPRGEVVGRRLFETFPELAGSPLEQQLSQALREKTATSFEYQLVTSPHQGWYRVHLAWGCCPEGVVLFFTRSAERLPPEQGEGPAQ